MGRFILVGLVLAASVASADVGDRGGSTEASVRVAAAVITEPSSATPETVTAPDATPDAPDDVTLAATTLQSSASFAFLAIGSAVTTTSTTIATLASDAALASDDEIADAGDTEPTAPVVLAKVPSAQELTLQYQRIGRELLQLQEQRGKFDCGGMIPRFKAIKLEAALASTATRAQLAVELAAMAIKIDRFRGIHIDSACLQNPLAAGCM